MGGMSVGVWALVLLLVAGAVAVSVGLIVFAMVRLRRGAQARKAPLSKDSA
ncbi:hypothetical protein GCM10007167_27270 [Vulcaniibacterium thermophilum]|jgi:hypothetical protein|uniref:Uncharacterized protein n=1 Tax=Vulcaniibacterium thermophilum TaxID=1169913 RepID=A0A918ZBK7_9GAMM|nr:hypothetical protein GCM10007167_27270 [Vulcaniibacterium thermophilum]